MRSIIFLLSFLFASTLTAQQYPFLSWSTADGLAQSQVRCIYQDHLGYLWIGTLGGVSQFDGRSFTNYAKQDGLINNQVNAITEIGDSAMVFGSLGGITIFNGHAFQEHPFPADRSNAQVNDFLASGKDELWIATEQGLLVFKNGAFSPFPFDENLGTSHVKRIFEFNGELIIATKQAIFAWDGTTLKPLVSENEISGSIMDCTPAGNDGLYIATVGSGLLHYSYQNDDFKIKVLDWDSNNITGIISGANGTYWVKSRDGLARLHQNGNVEYFGEAQGLSPLDIRALLLDRENNLWIGTNGGGIRKYCGDAFRYYKAENGLAGNTVMSILQTDDSTLWFGTYDNGISQKTGDAWRQFTTEDGLSNTRVWCSLQTSDGDLWFGTSGGLMQRTGDRFISHDASSGFPGRQVYSLAEDQNGTLWCGTGKGLCFKPVGENVFVQVDAVPGIKIRGILHDKTNNMWLATNEGVVQFDGKQVKRYFESDGLPDNSVFCIAKGPDNAIWVGTESGLCRIVDTVVEPLLVQGGFGANHINFISHLESGEVWIGTNDGLFHSSGYAHPEWRRLGRHDGLLYLETNQNAVLVANNLLWFGTSEALGCLDLKAFSQRRVQASPKIAFTQVRINLEEPKWDKYGVKLSSYGIWPTDLAVPHTDNHFTFFFDALSMSQPERMQYQFMLEGLESDWEPVTDINFATYSRLDYDDYVFRVRAIDSFGETSSEIQFPFTIYPPFWLTWWFIVIEVVVVGAIVWLIYTWRKRVLLEKVEKERLEYRSRLLSLEQQTLNSSMNRHFIFNALNSIQYYINRQDRLSANRYLSSFAKLIRKNLDSSQVNFTSLKEEIERLELYLELEHMRFKDKFTYTIEVEEGIDQESTHVPAMLLQPFLENSIWHGILPSELPGVIAVSIVPINAHSIAFRIVDNGIGIETSRKNKGENNNHISQGMTITGGRIELLRKMTGKNVELIGPYELTDDQQHIIGTCVEIIIPSDFSSFETK
jgi:ligand-binding sensor domain-containing protein